MAAEFVGIDHIQLAGPEGCEEAAREFFARLLGWPEIPKPANLIGRGGVWFRCGVHQVHIGVQKDFTPAKKAHPAFQVRELGELRERLKTGGVEVIDDDARADEGAQRFYVNDPFGNRLEFLEWIASGSKERFTERVDDYVKYRPSYPEDALDYLFGEVGLRPGSLVADIGAGTGIFSKLLLARGSRVIAVEPNEAMRSAADEMLGSEPNYRSVDGSAEATGLADSSVDFIVCAQSFHWFDQVATKVEFKRILRPGGKVVLIWNSRVPSGTPFLEGYEQLLHKYGEDYGRINHKNITLEQLRPFYSNGGPVKKVFFNRQMLDFDQLKGRAMSSSYVPALGHPNHDPFVAALRELFERNKRDGKVEMDYETEVYVGEV
ncbi:MAG: methyltransferase protein [Paenibacillaceae bacterium]|nr:methyltransferase protein [Paenibacillaceae bacterium]